MSLEEIITKIREKSKISKEEILKKINLKKKDLGGLITDEGAAYIIAKDMGINIFDGISTSEHKLKISDLIPGMNSVSITGIVKDIFPVKEFVKSDNRKGAVGSVSLVDKSGEIRTVFWDEKTKGLSAGNITPGKVIKIVRGYVKEGRDSNPELNVGNKSAILYPTDTNLENINLESKIISDFSNLKLNQSLPNVVGLVAQMFSASTFNRADGSQGQVMRVLLKGEIGSIRLVIWDDLVSKFDKIKQGDMIQLKNVYTRENRNGEIEIHSSSNSLIIENPEVDIEIKEGVLSGPLLIADLTEQLFDVEVVGKVISIYELKEFEKSDGSKGMVKALILQDSTGTIRTSFWDEKAKEIAKVKQGNILRIKHAYTRSSDFGINLNVSSKGILEINPAGVSIEEPSAEKSLKLSEINESQYNISTIGRVKQKFDIKDFEKTDGTKGKVLSLILVDESGSIRVVAWNDQVEKLININLGDILLVQGAYSRLGLNDTIEIHLGNLALIKINPKNIKIPALEKLSSQPLISSYSRKKIVELKPQDRVEILGTIVYVLSRNIVYPACPNCYKKVEKMEGVWHCNNCGDIEKIDYRMIYSVTIDDGSGTIRANLIGEPGERLINLTAEQAQNFIESDKEAEINSKLQSLVAKTFLFSGKVIFSDFSQDNELNVITVNPVEIEKEVKTVLDSFSD